MNRRTFEGPMDWEYQNQPPVDPSSPFAKLSQRPAMSPFASPAKFGSTQANPFDVGAPSRNSPFKPQEQPRPPHASFFNPQLHHKPSAPSFRNPAFTTPQKRVDELVFSEYSGAESSPAMTDTSEMPVDTPEADREEDFAKMTITAASAGRTLFGKSAARSRTPGRGEIPRGNRDKVRKRKRLQGDRDVGSGRPRLPHDSDDSDSDWEESDKTGGARKAKGSGQGWLNGFLSAVSKHPSAPAILSKWLQLGINVVLLSLVLFGVFAIVAQIRSDLSYANEKARAAIVSEMAKCSENYIKNQCSPRSTRAPALEGPCTEWETCMNQDSSAIMKVQVSARNVAEIMNEFVGVLTLKTWGFLLSLFLVVVLAGNFGFGFLRESALSHAARPSDPLHSPPAALPMLGAAAHDPRQAYIWAPISETPRHVRRNLFASDATDTENSPGDVKAIMPPQTPSGRRSPSKGERGRSPSKGLRSPSKGY
ncbi:Di-sulfide bridge nucleocytoplasmic transport domain-containing protein [Diplogelasinospora grovesii]|uniref:Di-sulfide bridge nucleocytoplasmic transport domain-containing protein n=1 Tax=Diplogelasinospora grovesii TaxID=303347 RepID=A0AAN6NAP3_9PEZI|nr:Di-sulfide bridge nucleocytoplasmic transport domain-containing protein [Diplogelasinospora grovesii]